MTKNDNQNLQLAVIPQTFLDEVSGKLDRFEKLLEQRTESEKNEGWIASETARKMLGISPRTWQNMRDQKMLPFAQIGRKIYVKRLDINAFLEMHLIRGK